MSARNQFLPNFSSAIAVAFVAIPINIGIALASGTPLFAGLLAGILGGIVAGSLSGSNVAVTGPAAGLAGVLLFIANDLGTFEAVLVVIILAGMLQIAFGYLRLGAIGHFFPSSVVSGMITGIGLILILKQIPHALGDDADYIGDESFFQGDKHNTFSEIYEALINISPAAVTISILCGTLLVTFDKVYFKKIRWLNYFPGPLAAVIVGIGINWLLTIEFPEYALSGEHLVRIPHIREFSAIFSMPDWQALSNTHVYLWTVLLACAASMESLLVIEAADKLDPDRRITPVNQELKAQGVTNVLCGLLGALPVAAVIVRTSANINAGARTKASTIMHGMLLVIAFLVLPGALGTIPLACLSAILIVFGYKLTRPSMWGAMWKKGSDQFIPFVVTVAGIVFTNLFIGVFIGLMVSTVFLLKSNFHSSIIMVNNQNNYLIKFTRDVSFFNRLALVRSLERIPDNATLMLEGSSVRFIDHDIIELLNDFQKGAQKRNIKVVIKRVRHALHPFFKSIES